MRKRKNMKKDESEASGGEEGEDFQDSGEDWTPDADGEQPPKTGRKRASKGAANNSVKKKKKASSSEESEGEEDEEEGEGEEGEEGEEEEESDEDKEDEDGNKSDSSQQKDIPKHYHSGNFVLLKSDVQWEGDTVTTNPGDVNLWKIDGKALLQKYVPTEANGDTIHKCTCVYSGWNVDNRDNYYPITDILDRNPKTELKEPCVSINLNDLIKVRDKH